MLVCCVKGGEEWQEWNGMNECKGNRKNQAVE